MNLVKFPKRRPDGSFCVEVTLRHTSGDTAALASELREWIATDWTPQNNLWTRNWSNGSVEELRYLDEFSAAPRLTSCENGELIIVLDGKPNAGKVWKDWLVSRMWPDIKKCFPEITDLCSIRDHE
jgi:hypothetical protein